MTHLVQQLIIHGLTKEGQRFRPSDWAERLAGVLSQFRPAGSVGGPLTYSPYAVPRVLDGVRCVVVDHRLRELEPLAWKFVCDFAADNHLQTSEREIELPGGPPPGGPPPGRRPLVSQEPEPPAA